MNAGITLIYGFEQNLQTLHQNAKDLCFKAQTTDRKIVPMFVYCSTQLKTFEHFVDEVQLIPKITTNIQSIKTAVEDICKRIDVLEDILSQETEIVASMQMDDFKETERRKTLALEKKKIRELEQFEHQLRIETYRREQKELELESLRKKQQLLDQIKQEREKDREFRLKQQELFLAREKEQNRMKESLNEAIRQEMQSYQQKSKSEKR